MATPSTGAVSTPDKKPSPAHFQGIVTIVVGKERKAYNLHKDLLCFYPDYLRAAFNGSFAEATQKKIKLPDVNKETFEEFHTWLYTRKLVNEDDKPLKWSHLANLWVFGDYFQMPMLQNCVMDEIYAKFRCERSLPLTMVSIAYKKTVKGSLLRKAAIDILAHDCSLGDESNSAMKDDYSQFFTVEMLQDLVREIAAARKNRGRVPERSKCFFHVHGKDEQC